jgi:hypothetical protein
MNIFYNKSGKKVEVADRSSDAALAAGWTQKKAIKKPVKKVKSDGNS